MDPEQPSDTESEANSLARRREGPQSPERFLAKACGLAFRRPEPLQRVRRLDVGGRHQGNAAL